MAPKTATKAAPPSKPEQKPATAAKDEDTTSNASGTKRKRSAKVEPDTNKAPRRTGRSATKTEPETKPKPTSDPIKLLNTLLSHSIIPLCRPQHEIDALAENPKLRAYTSTIPLSPFEELLAAMILSRPIGHSLGQRSFRYLINEPRNLRTPKAVRAVGVDQVHQWLDEARTQHKAKTAEQIVGLADVAIDKAWAEDEEDVQLKGLRKMIQADKVGRENGVQRLKETLKKELKGMGETGTEIFIRRVQGVWSELAPFIDKRTKGSLEKFGLPGGGVELKKLLEDNWEKLNLEDVEGSDETEKKVLAFVLLLERAVGADLEGHHDQVLEAAQ